MLGGIVGNRQQSNRSSATYICTYASKDSLTSIGIFPSERVRNTRPSDDTTSGTKMPKGLEAKIEKSSKR